MSEQQERDSHELATMLETLPKEDRLQIRGVITGMQMARRFSATGTSAQPDPGQRVVLK